MSSIIFSAIIIAVLVNILLVIILLVVKDKITPSGTVQIDINDGKRVLDVQQGAI